MTVITVKMNRNIFRADESARAASLYEAVKTYVGDSNVRHLRRETSEHKKRESSSQSDQKMRESFSLSDQRMKETNGNTEDENIDNGNISTDRSETGSASDEVNI